MIKGLKFAAYAIVAAGIVGVSSTTTASASKYVPDHSVPTLKSLQSYKYTTYHRIASKKNKGIRVYTSEYLTTYDVSKKSNVFTSDKAAIVKAKNGKLVKYRYVINSHGTVSGYVYSGYFTKKSSPKVKTVKVSGGYVIPKELRKSVSNTNVHGLKHVNDWRLAQIKLGKQMTLHPSYYTKDGSFYARVYSSDYFALYKNTLKSGKESTNQKTVDMIVTDLNAAYNYKSFNKFYSK